MVLTAARFSAIRFRTPTAQSVTIPSAAASAATTGPTDSAAYLVTGGNRPGWYNPGNGAQWLSLAPNQQNGGIPLNPPGNYKYQMNLSPYVNPNGGEVTITVADVNADNHFEFAIGNSITAQEYLAEPFATQETWGSKGPSLSFSFSPRDGSALDLIIANNNDQTNGAGKYSYQKNPTGFLISGMQISQASGPTPKQDKMVSAITINGAAAPGSGIVYRRPGCRA